MSGTVRVADFPEGNRVLLHLSRQDFVHSLLSGGEIVRQPLRFSLSHLRLAILAGLLQRSRQQQISNIGGVEFHGFGVGLNRLARIATQLRNNS